MNLRQLGSATLVLFGFVLIFGLVVSPVEAASVEPLRDNGSPGCSASSGGDRSLGYSFGITIVPPDDSTFRFAPSSRVAMTGPLDSDESLRISNTTDTSFDWSSTLPIDAVIVHSEAPGVHIYQYSGESSGDNGLSSLNDVDITHLEFCYDYELGFNASATGTFDNAYVWTVNRMVESTSLEGFIGDSFTIEHEIEITREIVPRDYLVNGEIAIINPAPYTVDLVVNVQNIGNFATVTCTSGTTTANYVTIPGNTTANCEYSTNYFADRSILGYWSLNPNVGPTGEGNAVIVPVPISWSATSSGSATTEVRDSAAGGNLDDEIGGNQDFAYEVSRECPADQALYTEGIYQIEETVTTTLTEAEVSAETRISITCYAPALTHTASANYSTLHTWELMRSAAPEAQAAFAGETVRFSWINSLTETTSDQGLLIRGTVTVANPSPLPMNVGLDIDLDDGTEIRMSDCAGSMLVGGSLLLSGYAQAVCEYSAAPGDESATLSSASVTLDEFEFVADVPLEWQAGSVAESITLQDEARANERTVSEPGDVTTTDSYICPDDPAVYNSDGMYFADITTSASIFNGQTELGSAEAAASVTCYLPRLAHEVTAGFDIRHLWQIATSVTPESQQAWAGESVELTWTVSLTNTPTDEGAAVGGSITVFNPHPVEELLIDLAAALDDGSPVMLECENPLQVAPGAESICAFSAAPSDNTATATMVTMTFNEVTLTDTQPVVWAEEPRHIDGMVSVDDDRHPEGFPAFDITGSQEWVYTTSYTCPFDPAGYVDGVLEVSSPNTAFVFTDEDILGTANTRSAITCYAPVISLTASASYEQHWAWSLTASTSASEIQIAADETQPISYLATLLAESSIGSPLIFGEITITNPWDRPLLLDSIVQEAASDIYARIQCDSLDIEPQGSLNCAYSADAAAPDPGSAVVRVGLNGGVVTASADYEFMLADERDECITLTDTHFPDDPVEICAADEEKTAAYTLQVGTEALPDVDIIAACGLSAHTNRIEIITSDSAEIISAEQVVQLNQICEQSGAP